MPDKTGMGDWTKIRENLMIHVGGTVYLRAKVGGKVIRKSIETSELRIATPKRDATLSDLRALVSTSAQTIGAVDDACMA